MSPFHYSAPWATAVRVITGLVTVLLIGVSFLVTRSLSERGDESWWLVGVAPLLILLASVPFTIRGYELQRSRLLVRRLFWSTEIPLDRLEAAWAEPEAMKGSWRLLGNGGLFSITGLYRNRTLGNYRALVMDPRRAVVLELGERKFVVSPDSPQRFLDDLRSLGYEAAVKT